MVQKSINTYEPASLSEVIFADDETKHAFDSLARGEWLEDMLLYGPPGTGKSTLAKMIPALVEPDVSSADIIRYDCLQYRSIDDIQQKIRGPIRLIPQGLRHYVILEEADGCSRDALAAMKTVMDSVRSHDLFIFVTNHEEKLNQAIRSRCREFYIGPAAPEKWLSRAKAIISKGTGKTIPDEALLPVLELGRGDGREIIRRCDDLIRRIKSHSAAETP